MADSDLDPETRDAAEDRELSATPEKTRSMTATEDLADLVRSTDSLATGVTDRSKLAIRDYLGVALQGTAGGVGETLRTYADVSPADGSSSVLDGSTAGPERACLLNGAYGHAVDYDDTFASFPLHPTTVVTPAALAAGELAGADGEQFLRAYAVGVETLYRVGRSVFPAQYERGFHSTAAVGPLGSAAAAGVLFDLERTELRHAFGIAASDAGGLRKNFGTTAKPLHAGFAASAGFRAAMLAEAGATADRDVLDGPTGYGAVMAGDEYDPSSFDDEVVGVEDIALKLYPSAHITHGAMEALRRLRSREGLSPDDVASVTATLHPGGRDVLIHSDPSDSLEAKFSLEFCLAAVLRTGSPTLSEFTDAYVSEPETRTLMETIEVAYDADAVADLGRYGGRVTLETTDGATHEAEAVDAPGSPRNPVSEDRLRAKFDACVERTPVDGDRLAAAVADLTDGGTVTDLLDALDVDR